MIINCDIDRYVEEVIKAWEYSLLFDYPTVIDIGANIGTFSLYIYNHCNRIYAIEPAKENCDNFRKTIEENQLDKIQLFGEAIAGNTGIRDIRASENPGSGNCSIVDLTGKPEEYRKVNAITLKDFMDRQQIDYADLIKIDVEGAEQEILTYFPSERVGTIIGEFHYAPHLINFDWHKILGDMGYLLKVNAANKFIARKR